ncbi:hypothetical protein LTR91_011613 [Friedmanniomyces endolithicus]|nr:hypothetical protein LTS09_010110 [Friedmanniomyces endolithicus]KAK0281296.1 hypothetical protein LTR35_007672 [Friedmanniomyces endolithicus]KAK0295257.1 hypothetical protein LTS00_006315 [Friedmanniomyces endolithicus]KAK0308082.1 hypothetical protein LTR01_005415 [Friedmanniomyces endolithicus]KAK0318639.1 hypothetical protein LTR82_010381 [Friedmanniomyces endolithicus]
MTPLTTLPLPSRHEQHSSVLEADTTTARASSRCFFPGSRSVDLLGHAKPVPGTAPLPTRLAGSSPATKPERIFSTGTFTFKTIKSIYADSDEAVAAGKGVGINLIRRQSDGVLYIEKLVAVSTAIQQARAIAEIDALTQLKLAGAPNYINHMLESFSEPGAAFGSIILEYCEAGTAYSLIKRKILERQQPTEALIWHTLAGLSKALHFCHTGIDIDRFDRLPPQDWNTVCHLDIKHVNVFFTHDGGKNGIPRLVLGDFGCATTWQDIQDGTAKRTLQLRGTLGWFPPECKASSEGGWDGDYGMPTDIWQTGAVAQAICRLIMVPDMSFVMRGRACGRHYSNELNDLVTLCMNADPLKRPRAAEVARVVKKQMEVRGLVF